MDSIVSFPDRGHWGDPKWRGNTSGRVYQALFEHFRPKSFCDPMMGSGTAIEVAREMGIEAYGFDLHSGFDILHESLLQRIGKPVSMCVSHPPYGDLILYSGEVWGREPDPHDLSRCASDEEFLDKMQLALFNERASVESGGLYGCLIGDKRRNGLYVSYQAGLIDRLPARELKSVIIKQQFHTRSESRRYARLRYPRVLHEYLLLWERPAATQVLIGVLAELACQYQRRIRATWKTVVQASLLDLGGRATLETLYARVGHGPHVENHHVHEKIRQTLGLHPDTFVREAPGTWRLAA